jgi:hypothetical protein
MIHVAPLFYTQHENEQTEHQWSLILDFNYLEHVSMSSGVCASHKVGEIVAMVLFVQAAANFQKVEEDWFMLRSGSAKMHLSDNDGLCSSTRTFKRGH